MYTQTAKLDSYIRILGASPQNLGASPQNQSANSSPSSIKRRLLRLTPLLVAIAQKPIGAVGLSAESAAMRQPTEPLGYSQHTQWPIPSPQDACSAITTSPSTVSQSSHALSGSAEHFTAQSSDQTTTEQPVESLDARLAADMARLSNKPTKTLLVALAVSLGTAWVICRTERALAREIVQTGIRQLNALIEQQLRNNNINAQLLNEILNGDNQPRSTWVHRPLDWPYGETTLPEFRQKMETARPLINAIGEKIDELMFENEALEKFFDPVQCAPFCYPMALPMKDSKNQLIQQARDSRTEEIYDLPTLLNNAHKKRNASQGPTQFQGYTSGSGFRDFNELAEKPELGIPNFMKTLYENKTFADAVRSRWRETKISKRLCN